jgi:hypothetical protein
VPFFEVVNEGRITLDVTKGKRPTRPAPEICAQRGLDDHLWNLIADCWKMKDWERPTATTVVKRLETYSNMTSRDQGSIRASSDWDPSSVGRFRSNLDEHPLSPPAAIDVGWIGGEQLWKDVLNFHALTT